MLNPEVSLPVGLATAGVVYAIYQNALPPVVDVRSAQPGNADVQGSEKLATWTALGVVSGISLLAKDPNVLIMGGITMIVLAWWHRHADMVIPEIGKAVPGSTVHEAQQVSDDNMDGSGDVYAMTSA